MNQIRMNGYVRISKAEARKRFNSSKEILIVPCKMRPYDRYYGGYYVTSLDMERDNLGTYSEDKAFDLVVGEFTYYNCQYNELGRYPAYYKKED